MFLEAQMNLQTENLTMRLNHNERNSLVVKSLGQMTLSMNPGSVTYWLGDLGQTSLYNKFGSWYSKGKHIRL